MIRSLGGSGEPTGKTVESKADEKVDEAKKAIIEDRNAAVVKAFEAVKDQFEFDAQKKLWNVKAGG